MKREQWRRRDIQKWNFNSGQRCKRTSSGSYRGKVTDLPFESSLERLINTQQRGAGTESRHAPPSTPTKLMTQGEKYRRWHKEAFAVGSVDFLHRKYRLQREHLMQQKKRGAGGGKQPIGTRGIHQSLNSTSGGGKKRAWIWLWIHVVKPHVLTNCKPHQHLDRSHYRAGGRGGNGWKGWRGRGLGLREGVDAWSEEQRQPGWMGAQRGGQEIWVHFLRSVGGM